MSVKIIKALDVYVTPDIALKLAKLTGTSNEFWTNLQSKYDAYVILVEGEKKDVEVYISI